MAANWHLESGGKEHGPLASSQLKQLAQQGRITPESRVRCGAEGAWVAASRVRGLFTKSPSPSTKRVAGPAASDQEQTQPAPQNVPATFHNGESESGIPVFLWAIMGIASVVLIGLFCYTVFSDGEKGGRGLTETERASPRTLPTSTLPTIPHEEQYDTVDTTGNGLTETERTPSPTPGTSTLPTIRDEEPYYTVDTTDNGLLVVVRNTGENEDYQKFFGFSEIGSGQGGGVAGAWKGHRIYVLHFGGEVSSVSWDGKEIPRKGLSSPPPKTPTQAARISIMDVATSGGEEFYGKTVEWTGVVKESDSQEEIRVLVHKDRDGDDTTTFYADFHKPSVQAELFSVGTKVAIKGTIASESPSVGGFSMSGSATTYVYVKLENVTVTAAPTPPPGTTEAMEHPKERVGDSPSVGGSVSSPPEKRKRKRPG